MNVRIDTPGSAGPLDIDVDILIVGAGPAGLYAAYCAGFRGLSLALIDNLPEPGGQVSALYPEKKIFDIAALPSIRGRDLVDNLVQQTETFDPVYLLGEQACTVVPQTSATEAQPNRWAVHTDHGRWIRCGAIVITGGIGRFDPRPLEAAAAWEGRGLTYHVPRLEAHTGHDVVIVGGGDSAVDWALALEPIAESVTVIHRRAKFRAHDASVKQLVKSRCSVITDAQIHAAHGDDRLRGITVQSATGARFDMPVDAVIGALGFIADLGPLESWGIEIVNRRITVDTRMQTCRPGIFAAGDITDYAGKVRLISVGFGEAALAVHNAATHLDPSQPLAPGHSSDNPPTALSA